MPTEADICRILVLPKLYAAGWADDQIAEQRCFTDGRIVVQGNRATRRPGKRADYLLRYTRDVVLAVVEAKAAYKQATDGLQQAKDYAQILGLNFAYATNGHSIIEFDFITGKESELCGFPSPTDLWSRLCAAMKLADQTAAERLLTPVNLIIVDECHRGNARDDSNWREILEYFEPAYQLGMTATPLRQENKDTYLYFGNPVYTYSLKQGIDDGFLAPYRVHRIVTQWDAAGWRPSKDDLDRYGRVIPDEQYQTADFERLVSLRARTQAIARHLTDFLKKTDRFAKTIVFCVDQEHASEMRTALNNLNADLVAGHVAQASLPASSGGVSPPGPTVAGTAAQPAGGTPSPHLQARMPAPQGYPDYVCRVTADEGEVGRGHMERFQDVETRTPVILTTSQLLTTGLDAPTCRNVVLVRLVNSMVEFKQIIGRGTRVRDDYGKLWFNILDYTGTATRNFVDPAFDGDPAFATQEEIDESGKTKNVEIETPEEPESTEGNEDNEGKIRESGVTIVDGPPGPPLRKYYFDGGAVEIAADLVYELDADGKQLRVVKLTDYTSDKVRSICRNAIELRARWSDPEQRAQIIEQLHDRGLDFQTLAVQAGKPDADPFDLLCHLAFNAPVLTRRQRANRVKKQETAFFKFFPPEAREILDDLLEKYAADGELQFTLPDVLKVPPISNHGNVAEIIGKVGGPDQLRNAVNELQTLLYAA